MEEFFMWVLIILGAVSIFIFGLDVGFDHAKANYGKQHCTPVCGEVYKVKFSDKFTCLCLAR